MTRDGARYSLTAAEILAIENGRAVGWAMGRARGAIGRDPGDGRYLWSVTFPGRRASYDASRDTWEGGIPKSSAYGRADTLADALFAVRDAHMKGRPE